MDLWIVTIWVLTNMVLLRIGFCFMVSMLLPALVERVGVSRLRDFLYIYIFQFWIFSGKTNSFSFLKYFAQETKKKLA